MKLSEIIQALANQYFPNLSPSLNTESDASVQLFYGKHEITSFDFQTIHLTPLVSIQDQCQLIEEQILSFIASNPDKFPELSSISPQLPLEDSFDNAKRLSEIKWHESEYMSTSDEQHTYVRTSNAFDKPIFSKFLRLALLQKIGSEAEFNHPLMTFPLASNYNIEERRSCTSKFPLQSSGKTLREIESSQLSYQQWLNILTSLYLIMEQLTYLGINAEELSSRHLEILETGHLKLIHWEKFRSTLDCNRPRISGWFGAVHYLNIFLKITHKISKSKHLTPQEHASLLALTLNVIEVLRKGEAYFGDKRHPTQIELAQFHTEVLSAFQSSLKMPDLQASLSTIAHQLPATQLHRINNATLLIPTLSEISEKIDTAIEIGFMQLIELLLITNTIAPHQVNEQGQTLLFRACKYTQRYSYDLVELLMNKFKANPNDQDNFGNTSLVADILNPSYPGMNLKTLLDNGANPNHANHEGNTPLHFICDLLPKDSVSLVALPDPLSSQDNISLSNATKITQTLLTYGANPLTPNHEGLTPVDIANQNGFVELYHILMTHISKNTSS